MQREASFDCSFTGRHYIGREITLTGREAIEVSRKKLKTVICGND